MQGGNRLLGVVRVRMLKVLPGQDCQVSESLRASSGPCYGQYSEDAEDTEPFGPINENGQPLFMHSMPVQGQVFTGKVAHYSRGGFMAALTADYLESMKDMEIMETEDFISLATRAVILEFTIYNFNLGFYGVCRMAFELAPSGRWTNTFDVEVLQQRHLSPLGFGTGLDWLMLLGEAGLILFVLRYAFEELSELSASSRKILYFMDAWNWVDWMNLLLIVVTLRYRVVTWSMASSLEVFIGDPAKQGPATFTDMTPVAMSVRLIRNFTAFNAVLIWFKAVKYISVVPYITLFMETVSKSQKEILSFCVIFLVCFYGFILAYSTAFGEQFTVLRTLWKTFIFLMRSYLGDADMALLYDAAPYLGSLLISLFVVIMFFVVMNLFSAIMLRALAAAKTSDAERAKEWQRNKDRMWDFWQTTSRTLRLELRFRTCVPGLYSRMMTRRKKRQELERQRDLAVLERRQVRRADDLQAQALGPGSPQCGRRQRRALASVTVQDESESEESEADLGPLKVREDLQYVGDALEDEPLPPGMPGAPMAAFGEPTPETTKLIIDATRHVAAGIVDRTRGARGVLFREMNESRDVLLGVSAVLEVLSRRARSIEAQQEKVLKLN
mmetsp:Transcript_118284/g.359807  ORF Transcript_118284/g.359807 Transcript_118284/m.359807 type:complete len:613 (+) Transcript_118284:1-1839(+)